MPISNVMSSVLDQFKVITTFIFDVDGVLTDGLVYVFNNGEQVRGMSIRDGYALQLALKKKYRVMVVSGGDSEAVVRRLEKLGITDVHINVKDKKSLVSAYMQKNRLGREEVLYMGDDIPDIEAMKEVGLACAPADAATELIRLATYISTQPGGRGCVREVIEKVLKLNDHWDTDTDIPAR
jgi:3-deoxy-D-manno-octulosonate 8-phosphate phosphatase (KDO 8-P phosphatase)